MFDRFKNKYRIESARLKNWDYGRNAAYFITICTKDRLCFLGDVVDGKMILNNAGKIARDCWLSIPEKFPFAKLDTHVIMPNHMHGIVIIDKPVDGRNNERKNNEINRIDTTPVETRLIASLPDADAKTCADDSNDAIDDTSNKNTSDDIPNQNKIPGGITGTKNPMLHDNLSRIIRWYKGRVTFESRKICEDFAWQPRFHDHIIRNDKYYQRISDYIRNNPLNWVDDRFYI